MAIRKKLSPLLDLCLSKDYLSFWPTVSDERAIKEVDFIEKVLNLHQGGKVLDLCCGSGRHANILAQRGYAITGIDVSKILITMAQREARERHLRIKYELKDVRILNSKQKFDACYNFFSSFGFYTDGENYAILENVHRALRPGGRFLLDIINREMIIRHFRPNHISENKREKVYLLSLHELDIKTSRLLGRWLIIRKGREKEYKTSERLYTLCELSNLMQGIGFTNIRSLGGMGADTPYTIDSPRMIIVAEKQ